MRTSENGIALIKSFEGLRLTAYRDVVGVWTIGYGTTLGVTPGELITEQQATEFLQRDLVVFENTISANVKVSLNQNQFDALVSLTYNIGSGNFKRSTLLRILNTGNYIGCAQQFLVWNKAGGKPVAGLTNRRGKESVLFLQPV